MLYAVVPYRRKSGQCPYDEVLELAGKTGKKGAARIDVAVTRLAELGTAGLVKISLSEKMNDVWQLRPGKFRVFYFWDDKRQRYVLLNGYRKATRKTPPGEMERAERLMEECLGEAGNR